MLLKQGPCFSYDSRRQRIGATSRHSLSWHKVSQKGVMGGCPTILKTASLLRLATGPLPKEPQWPREGKGPGEGGEPGVGMHFESLAEALSSDWSRSSMSCFPSESLSMSTIPQGTGTIP